LPLFAFNCLIQLLCGAEKRWRAAPFTGVHLFGAAPQLLLGGSREEFTGVEIWGQGLVEKYARVPKKICQKKICQKSGKNSVKIFSKIVDKYL